MLFENLKKELIESLQTASAKTVEYTKIGKIKIDILGVKKEIEEKLLELGGRVYHSIVEEKDNEINKNVQIRHLIEQVKELESELNRNNEELNRIRKKVGG